MPLEGAASPDNAAPAGQPPGPDDPAGLVPQAAAVHITSTRAVSRTSVLLRDASQELAQRPIDPKKPPKKAPEKRPAKGYAAAAPFTRRPRVHTPVMRSGSASTLMSASGSASRVITSAS
jgi:hypothetical protein